MKKNDPILNPHDDHETRLRALLDRKGMMGILRRFFTGTDNGEIYAVLDAIALETRIERLFPTKQGQSLEPGHTDDLALMVAYVKKNLPAKLNESMDLLIGEAFALGGLEALEVRLGIADAKPYQDKKRRVIRDAVTLTGRAMRTRLKNIRVRRSRFDFTRFPYHYDKYYTMCKGACKLRDLKRQELGRARLRDTLVAAYPEIPKDRIDVILGNEPVISRPSSLALEIAARKCGVPGDRDGDSYDYPYLFRVLRKVRGPKKARPRHR